MRTKEFMAAAVPVHHRRRGKVGHARGNRKIKPESGRFRVMGVLPGTDRDRTFEPIEKSGVFNKVLQHQTKFVGRVA